MSGVKTLHCTHTFTSSHSDRLPHIKGQIVSIFSSRIF